MAEGGGAHRSDAESQPAVEAAAGWGRPGRRLPRRLWLIVALQAMLMLGASVLYPPFQQPDEAAHIDYVLAHRHGVWFAGPGQRLYQSGVLEAQRQVANTQATTHVGARPVQPRGERRSFDALGTAPATTAMTPLPNQMVQHPPLYYGLAAGFSYLLPGFTHRGWDVQIFWLRLFSVLLMLPVPILIFLAGRRVAGDDNLALVAALLPLAIPSYLRTGASVTNDSLLVLLTTALMLFMVRVAWGDLSRRSALWAGVSWGADLLTKGFALDLAPFIVAAYLVGARGHFGARVRQAVLPALICGLLGSAIGAWWWVRNVILYDAVQPNGFGAVSKATKLRLFPTTPSGTLRGFVHQFLRILPPRVFGSLGLIDVPTVPRLLLWALAVAAVVLVGVSVAHRNQADGWTPVRALLLFLPVLLTIAVMALGALHPYLHGLQLPGLQARYLEPDFLGVAVCMAVALRLCARRFARYVAPALLTAVLLFLALSAYKVLSVEMSRPLSDRIERLKSGILYVERWAPWPAAITAALAGVGALVELAALAAFWRAAALTEPDERSVPAHG